MKIGSEIRFLDMPHFVWMENFLTWLSSPYNFWNNFFNSLTLYIKLSEIESGSIKKHKNNMLILKKKLNLCENVKKYENLCVWWWILMKNKYFYAQNQHNRHRFWKIIKFYIENMYNMYNLVQEFGEKNLWKKIHRKILKNSEKLEKLFQFSWNF